MQVFSGVAEGGRQENLSVLAQLISDPDEELLELHRILKDLWIRPAKQNEQTWTYGVMLCKTKSFNLLRSPGEVYTFPENKLSPMQTSGFLQDFKHVILEHV